MFYREVHPYFLKKIALFFITSTALIYGETSVTSIEEFNEPSSAIAQFLSENLYITPFDYDRALGMADLFKMSKNHHAWKQIGLGGHESLGVGGGYRYLFKGDYPYQDWFFGIYSYGSWRPKTAFHRLHGNIGAEIATAHWQYTLNGYGTHLLSEAPQHYRVGDLGFSLRVSTYYYQKIGSFGRLNPFGVIAATRVQNRGNLRFVCFDSNERLECLDSNDKYATIEEIKKSTWEFNYGVGLRWEFSYIAFEIKAIRDTLQSAQWLGCRYQGGFQLNFAGKDAHANYPRHRVREMPQRYEPLYDESVAEKIQINASHENHKAADNQSDDKEKVHSTPSQEDINV